jgi:hypothetical protein
MPLRRKVTFRASDRKVVLVKKAVESQRHVVMKALLWALYLPAYPALQVEVSLGAKYKPDLVQMGRDGPVFWGEAGRVGSEKLRSLFKRYPRTHFALAVWGPSVKPLQVRIDRKLRGVKRLAPIDVIAFPKDADTRFIDRDGRIHVSHDALVWRRTATPGPL